MWTLIKWDDKLKTEISDTEYHTLSVESRRKYYWKTPPDDDRPSTNYTSDSIDYTPYSGGDAWSSNSDYGSFDSGSDSGSFDFGGGDAGGGGASGDW